MKSYSSRPTQLTTRLSEAYYLFQRHRGESDAGAQSVIAKCQAVEEHVQAVTGLWPRGMTALDIGSGQQLKHAKYFALFNEAVHAVDNDMVLRWSPFAYWRLWRDNGFVRLAKTGVRQMLGFDRRFDSALNQAFGQRPQGIVPHQMDAGALDFPENGFDFVYSLSVFEHLEDPERVAREVARVLKPGGVMYLGAHLYTCDAGCHDPRLLSGRRGDLPLWPHLRPGHRHRVQTNAYLNQWRLHDYINLFQRIFPGVTVRRFQRMGEQLRDPLRRIRAAGELDAYSDDELLTDEVAAIWRKPIPGEAKQQA
jgi:SAM-dependent methyltransferase